MSTSKEKVNKYNADGKREGYWELHYSTGQIWRKGNFTNGKEVDWWEGYILNGNLTQRRFHVNI